MRKVRDHENALGRWPLMGDGVVGGFIVGRAAVLLALATLFFCGTLSSTGPGRYYSVRAAIVEFMFSTFLTGFIGFVIAGFDACVVAVSFFRRSSRRVIPLRLAYLTGVIVGVVSSVFTPISCGVAIAALGCVGLFVGLGISAVGTVLLVEAVGAGVMYLSDRGKFPENACQACGYDLRGSPPGGDCPECGAGRDSEAGSVPRSQ